MESVKRKERTNNEAQNVREEMDFLVQNGEWQALTENDHYQKMSRSGRIITVHKAISVRLDQLNQHYGAILNSDSRAAEQFLETQINPLHTYKDFLSQALVWQENGQESDAVPQSLQQHLR